MCINSFLCVFLLSKFKFISLIDTVQFNVVLALCKLPLISKFGGLSRCSATMYPGKMVSHKGERRLLAFGKAG